MPSTLRRAVLLLLVAAPMSGSSGAMESVGEERGSAAWHEAGHAIVCEIAWRELDPETRRAVEGLLSADPDFERLAPACSWPDLVRGRAEYREFTTAHYVNLPPDAEGLEVERDCAETLCVIEAIDLFAARLGDTSQAPEIRLEALKFLGHLVGDVHQPLHVGYGHDLGGNAADACLPGGRSTNLHAVWDGFIVARRLAETGLDWRAFAERLHGEIHPIERRQWGGLDAVAWAEESYALVESEVYVDAGNGCFTNAYAVAHGFTVERRLKQAGFRLGALLDEILGTGRGGR